MAFVLNIFAGTITAIAILGGLIIAGNMASGDPATARGYLPYTFGGWLIGLDLLLRTFYWRRIVANSRLPTLLTREGSKAPPRRRGKEILEALFSNETGGQFFYILPVWLVGAGIIVLALCWKSTWLVSHH